MNNVNTNLTWISNFAKAIKDEEYTISALQQILDNDPIEIFKRGHKIKIKEKNKGKFTEYCGGKVTSECIKRGKNSPNSTIRKRATFAANARTFKH